MMHPARRRLFPIAALSTVAFLAADVATAQAQALPTTRYKNGSLIRRAFRSVVSQVKRSTVVVQADGKQTALGAFVDSGGHVITKASRLKGEIRCVVGTRVVDAEIVGIAIDDDLALLKLDIPQSTPVKWRKGVDPGLGQWLASSGAGDLPVAVGIMSVKRRKIPSPRPLLGVSIEDHEKGAKVIDVSRDSGAAKAGLKVGDIITLIAGTVVKNRQSLADRIRQFRPGDSLAFEVLRGDSRLKMKAILGSSLNPRSRGAMQNQMGGKLSVRRHGFPVAIQHDTYLRPEECGGPIVDLKGNVVGINIARAGRTESYAIPADRILSLMADLKSGKLAPKKPQSTSTSTDGKKKKNS